MAFRFSANLKNYLINKHIMGEKIRFFPKIIKATKSFMDIHIHSSLRGLDA
jgi:uncharacterized Fe-S cluster-containing protein